MNAAAARGAAELIGVETAKVNEALEWFAGTWRRFEYKGEVNGAPVYDDYGHHPTELRATFAGVRELYPDHKLKVIFQSHTYSRTYELFADFVSVLATADEVSLLPIYAAREENQWGVTSEKLAAAIIESGTPCTVYETIPACALAVKESLAYEKKEVVLVIGAGAVTEVARLLTE